MRPDDVSPARVERFVDAVYDALVEKAFDGERPAWVFVKMTHTRTDTPLAEKLLSRMSKDEIERAANRLREEKWIVKIVTLEDIDGDVHFEVTSQAALDAVAKVKEALAASVTGDVEI